MFKIIKNLIKNLFSYQLVDDDVINYEATRIINKCKNEGTWKQNNKFSMKKEYILCSAIWFKDGIKHVHQPKNIETGFVICGRRHHNCFATAYILIGSKRKRGYDEIQGFLTNTDRFVDREEAMQIAVLSNQIEKRDNASPNRLFSEDLW